MAADELPDPVTGVDRSRPALRALERELRRAVHGEVRFDDGSRAVYATDASNYRQLPLGVVLPRSPEAAEAAVAVCRRHDAPVLSRGGGTSLAGQCCNEGVVLDWSKYGHRLESVDTEARTCVVQPGIVLDELNRRLAPHGLQYGPRPATHPNCTLGGMIGNNSCGSTAQAYGKVADNIRRLEVLTYGGTRLWVGRTDADELARRCAAPGAEGELFRSLLALRDRYLEQLRTGFPDIPRRVSGYNLDALLPERGFDVAALLVGSESTLATVLRAELDLVPVPAASALVVLGYPDVTAAADHVPAVLEHRPHALEGVDHRLVAFERAQGANREGIDALPDGRAFLLVEFAADSREEADARARELIRSAPGTTATARYDDPGLAARLWAVREAGLGATAHPPGLPESYPGWEDSAVPPHRLGAYLRDLLGLIDAFGYLRPSLYGHFGQGCVHCRMPFDVTTADGVATMRRFVESAADLVSSYGGSLSGEHGDGQARGELLERMFGPELMEAFARLKAVFDPRDRMNPGKVVAARRLDRDLRLGPGFRPREPDTAFAYPEDSGSFARATQRCVGIGRCRSLEDGVMCPSYRVTREEEHSTRGRARLLFEMVSGQGPVDDGWRSTEVRDALDLCLACKGCKTDCPVNVDMATYKAEFLHHHYAGRLRPAAHYSLGWLPLLARAAGRVPRLTNTLTQAPGLGRLAKSAAGVAPERTLPLFAAQRFTDWWRARGGPRGGGSRGPVLLWPDTFTNTFQPAVGRAAVEVLEAAGFHVKVPTRPVCCGLTWMTTGQLGIARRVLRHTVATLRDDLRGGIPVVGLEPSCTAVFRSDAPDLLPEDADVRRLRERTTTFAELLGRRAPDWQPPTVLAEAVVQRHCHQYAITGFDADERLMRRTGLTADVLDAGCCGLAGNFGFERGHYELSQDCAEYALFPALRALDAGTLVLADGFSCRTQIEQSDTGRTPLHLAEVLAAGLRADPAPHADRPRPPSRAATRSALAATTAVTAAGATAAARRLRHHGER
ncbi:FAD-binding and (Fe-S)-binding domain-containing protein [Streptomyces sp. WMMC1477]|uniref:FAD-binding and (Fe-S)-binding domain-containing protein n=1 Tax=Streptomyces sp. WMMC1477 TaxID=3015155 RepID=UPI0022B61401|nr:FAD-binding and (Fe-S)-binding domain-containing protein [Streptomyces sp. WMMC1477]MCZ7430228.1 FAD-binding and (Fe-S)-binding domain-containing protein [Streptomyces sp. WMMC1477]